MQCYEERNGLFQGNWIDTAEEIDDLFLGDAEVPYSVVKFLELKYLLDC
jgi:hypothetical protein